MLNLNLNDRDTLLKFDQQLPVYNWYYPFPSDDDEAVDTHQALLTLKTVKEHRGRRALYFHVPFCDTLCTFCPFYRLTNYTYLERVDHYVDALIAEMKWKSQYPGVGKVPVDMIAVGGGTPSVLTVDQIRRFGAALREHFDLSELKEFTFELEVKSVTPEKLQAMKEIGVNRASFGVQTFHPVYREIFNITSTPEQVRQVAKWATETFAYVNIDIIFGLAGQSLDDLMAEADAAIALGTTTVDFYPLNYMSASLKMHRQFKERGLEPLSPATKIGYRMFLDEYMRAKGYIPINGYSYTRDRKERTGRVLLDRDPVFQYHDVLYGYSTDEVIGFGASAVTQAGDFNTFNPSSLDAYIDELQREGSLLSALTLGNKDCPEKGIVYFPYRGVLEKDRIEWERVPDETRQRLAEAVQKGLVADSGDRYTLTQAGWLFYVNLVYFLTPTAGQQWLNERIEKRIEEGRDPDAVQLYELV